jgi:hypothetical protein
MAENGTGTDILAAVTNGNYTITDSSGGGGDDDDDDNGDDTLPDTGLLDDNPFIIILGSSLLVSSLIAYATGFGSRHFSVLLAKLEVIQNDLLLRITYPIKHMRKHFTKDILREVSEEAHEAKD